MEIRTSEDPVAAAAAELDRTLRAAIDASGRARLAVPGGSALAAFVRVAKHAPELRDRVALTWADERCVPVGSDDSNRGALHRALEGPLPHELPLWLDGETVDQALSRVRSDLDSALDGGLDVTLLGMGPDGHIASLFVRHEHPEGARVVHVPNSPKPPPARMSLTTAMLGTAERALLVVSGESKKEALRRLANGDDSLPASRLPGLIVFTDQEIA